jgi:hypothetical protein
MMISLVCSAALTRLGTLSNAKKTLLFHWNFCCPNSARPSRKSRRRRFPD